MKRLVFALAAALVAATMLVGAQQGDRFAILNARILDPFAGRLLAAPMVTVNGGTIEATQDTGTPAPPAGLRTIDAKQGVLVPPIADLWLQVAATMDLDRDYFHALSLAHGVMRVRTVDGRLPMSVQDRVRIDAHEILAPRTWVAGPTIELRRPLGLASAPVLAGGLMALQQVDDATGASRAVTSQADAGVNWIRLGGNVTPPVVAAVVKSARVKKLKVSAEARAASMLQLAQAGVSLIDGLGFPTKGQGDLEATWKGRPDAPTDAVSAEDAAWAQVTAAEMRTLVTTLVRMKTAVAPMLRAADAQREDGPTDELDFVPDRTRGTVMSRVAKATTPAAQERRTRARAQRFAFVKAFVGAGGTLVLSSGARADGYPAPGLALHKEMALLVEAGLTPAQAWKAASANGAVLLGDTERRIRLRASSPADFFLVSGDPLADLAPLSQIALLVRNGETLDRAALLRRVSRARGVVK